MSRKAIFSRLVAGARTRDNQSDVFRWFIQHHDEFAEVLAGVSRPGWKAIAAELQTEGLTGKDGASITATYARQAWWRADRAYTKSRPPKPAAILAPEPKPASSTPSQPPPVIIIDDEPEEDFKLIRAGKPRAFTPKDFNDV